MNFLRLSDRAASRFVPCVHDMALASLWSAAGLLLTYSNYFNAIFLTNKLSSSPRKCRRLSCALLAFIVFEVRSNLIDCAIRRVSRLDIPLFLTKNSTTARRTGYAFGAWIRTLLTKRGALFQVATLCFHERDISTANSSLLEWWAQGGSINLTRLCVSLTNCVNFWSRICWFLKSNT